MEASSFNLPSPEAIARARELAETRRSPGEFDALVNAPFSDRERENAIALIEWFTRRYPTPAARLAYARRAYERWKRSMPGGSKDRGDSTG